MALRGFIARCEEPNGIISENAAQFRLSKSTIGITWEKIVKDRIVHLYITKRGRKWKLIIELSMWMGGFYERLVVCRKIALRKSIGKKYFTQLQLQTFLPETEAVLNSRPFI